MLSERISISLRGCSFLRLLCGPGLWRGGRCGARLYHKDRAVGRPQVLACGLLNQLGSDFSKLGFECVNAGRIVVEQREAGQQVRGSKSRERAEPIVEARSQLGQRAVEDRALT